MFDDVKEMQFFEATKMEDETFRSVYDGAATADAAMGASIAERRVED